MAGHHFEVLYKAGLSFATQNMESDDGFIPFAITVDHAGERRVWLPGPDPSILDTAGQVDLLERLLKERIGDGSVAACVLVTDALYRNPETGEAIDILSMDMDDAVGGHGRLVFPYRMEDGKVRVGRPSMAEVRVRFFEQGAPPPSATSPAPEAREAAKPSGSLLGRLFGRGKKGN